MTIPLDVLRRIVAGADRIKADSMTNQPDSFALEIEGFRAIVGNSIRPHMEYEVTLLDHPGGG